MARKAAKKTSIDSAREEEILENQAETKGSFFDYLRFGESYTSLILGIVVVIISTVLLLSFVHNRNVNKVNNQNIAQVSQTPTNIEITATSTPTPTAKSMKVVKATAAPAVRPTQNPTAEVTKKVTPTPTKTQPKAVAQNVTPIPTKVIQEKTGSSNGSYTVMNGDNLWKIAEKKYKSGYNWVDIARANNLNNPSNIHSGDKLVLPKVASKLATASKGEITPVAASTTKGGLTTNNAQTKTQIQANKIIGNKYKIVRGDNLWNIAVRAYGDGFKWVDIAKANKLMKNPGLIHADNNLIIPRG